MLGLARRVELLSRVALVPGLEPAVDPPPQEDTKPDRTRERDERDGQEERGRDPWAHSVGFALGPGSSPGVSTLAER